MKNRLSEFRFKTKETIHYFFEAGINEFFTLAWFQVTTLIRFTVEKLFETEAYVDAANNLNEKKSF